MVKVNILSDWNQKLDAYKVPEDFIDKISNKSTHVSFNFYDKKNKDLINVYIGNLPSEKNLLKYKNLKWLHFGSVGIDKISEDFIVNKELTVTNSQGLNTKSVTTYCLGELFSSCKSGFMQRKTLSSKKINRNHFNPFFNKMIDFDDIKLTVLGFGDIGKNICEISSGLFKEINVVTKTKRKDKNNLRFYSLEELKVPLRRSTHIINVLPLTLDTRNLLTEEVFSSFKEDSYYICAGRAETHSLNSLFRLLDRRKIMGASIDVWGLPNGKIPSDFYNLQNIKITPHISGWTKNFWINQEKLLSHNINQFRNNREEKMKNLKYLNGIKIS